MPGISRFGTTYVVARWLSLSPRRALELSFLIEFPLILGAFLWNGVIRLPSDLAILLVYSPFSWFVGGSAAVLGYFLLRFSYRWGIEGKFWRFGVYMILPSLVLLYVIRASGH